MPDLTNNTIPVANIATPRLPVSKGTIMSATFRNKLKEVQRRANVRGKRSAEKRVEKVLMTQVPGQQVEQSPIQALTTSKRKNDTVSEGAMKKPKNG